MDTGTLVDNRIDAGQRLLDELDLERVVVRAACWIKPSEEDRWSLYIATPAVEEKGILEAYRQVLPALRSLGDDWITSTDVKLVEEKHPLVRDAQEMVRRFPHSTPIRSPRSLLGGIPAEEVYVYQLDTVDVTIYGMVFRGEPGSPLYLSLEPPNPNSWHEVEDRGKRTVYPAKTGMDWVVAAPKGAKVERNGPGPMVLTWDRHGKRIQSNANEVWTLAKLRLHGFRFRHEPA